MQIARKRLAAIAAACALAALVFGGVYAVAVANWLPEPGNTLTVIATEDSGLKADIESGTAEVVVDVYKVADAVADDRYETLNYELVEPFNTDTIAKRLADAQEDSESGRAWELFAEQALSTITDNDKKVVTIDSTASGAMASDGSVSISLPDNGLYLVVPHGPDVNPATPEAEGLEVKYKFNPSMISLPTKYGANYDDKGYMDGEAKTSDSGEWHNTVTIALKYSEEPLTGQLIIKKNLTHYQGSPITCKFLVKSTDNSPYVYENVASVYVSSDKGGSTTITGIPARTLLTVEEIYPGAGYSLVGSEPENAVIEIHSDKAVEVSEFEIPSVTFTNKPEDHTQGHGIENKFEYDAKQGKWTLVDSDTNPEGAQHDGPNA